MKRRGTQKCTVVLTTICLFLLLSLGGFAYAQEATVVPYTPVTTQLSGKIEADGSSTVGPITEAVAEEFNKIASDVEVQVNISGTGGGFKRFCAGETDLQDASRPIKDEELATCTTNNVEFTVFEVAYDGITVVTNKDNDWLHCMNWDALKLLWQEQDHINKWNELNADFPNDTINVYGPGTDSGTYDYFNEKVLGKDDKGAVITGRTDYTPSEDDNVLVEGVAQDTNSLGFFGFAYYENNQDKLNVVAIDGGSGCVLPSSESIQDLSYPFARPLFVYVNNESLKRPEVQEFMRYYVSNAAALATDVGYVASPNQVYLDDQQELESIITTT